MMDSVLEIRFLELPQSDWLKPGIGGGCFPKAEALGYDGIQPWRSGSWNYLSQIGQGLELAEVVFPRLGYAQTADNFENKLWDETT